MFQDQLLAAAPFAQQVFPLRDEVVRMCAQFVLECRFLCGAEGAAEDWLTVRRRERRLDHEVVEVIEHVLQLVGVPAPSRGSW